MGRQTQRKSINALKPASAVSILSRIQWSHMPPCVFAIMLKSERAMQRALTSMSHAP